MKFFSNIICKISLIKIRFKNMFKIIEIDKSIYLSIIIKKGSFTLPCATCASTSESHCTRGRHVSAG